jgi:hypothetical protein
MSHKTLAITIAVEAKIRITTTAAETTISATTTTTKSTIKIVIRNGQGYAASLNWR